MDYTPKSEIYNRISNFQKNLASAELDGAIVLLNSDMFYFTGTVQNSFLFVPASGEPVLMIKKSLRRGEEESPLKNIVPIKSHKQIPDILSNFGYNKFDRIGLELDVMPVNLYKSYTKVFPQTEFVDVSRTIRQMRSIKSPYEIELVRGTMKVIDQAFKKVPDLLHEGMTEVELAALFEAEMRKRGYSGCSKMRSFNQDFLFGDVCSGESGFYPSFFDGPVGGQGLDMSYPKGAGWKKIKRNEVVYIDYSCVIRGYTGDQTRVFCMGELPEKLVKAFDASVRIESEVIKAMKPGTLAEDSYYLSLKLAKETGFEDNFMGYKNDRVKFLGHGIGVELDDWPVFAKGFKMPIVPGMTFALEPKFVFPEGAIGIESSFVMTENGPENISITPETITYLK